MITKHCVFCKKYVICDGLCHNHKMEYDTLCEIIKDNYNLNSYKIVLAKKIKKNDVIFDTWLQNNRKVTFYKKTGTKVIISTNNTMSIQNYGLEDLVAKSI